MHRIVWHGPLFGSQRAPRLVRWPQEVSSVASLSTALLDTFLGLSIEQICPLKFGTVGDEHNHCAHFVGHVLKLNSSVANGLTCAGMVYAGKEKPVAGALIRVNDIFNFCAVIDEPNPLGCLVYYTLGDNIGADGKMGSMRKKHVGICIQGYVYHYGNTNDKVRRDGVGGLAKLYGRKTITLYTQLPMGHTVLALEEIRRLAG